MRFIPSCVLSLALAVASSVGLTLPAWAGPVDINTADASTLAKELNGIGPARAAAIVAYRNQHGPFKSVDDLALVKNLPQKVIDANRELLRVGGAPAKRAESRPAPRAEGTVARAPAGAKAGSKPAPRD